MIKCLSVFALAVVLTLVGAACGKKDAPAETTPSGAAQVATPPATTASSSPENLGRKIGSSYVLTLEQVVAIMRDKLPADQVKTMFKDMKAGTIDLMVGMGKEREAMPVEDRAVVDRILSDKISGISTDLFKQYQDGQTFYKDDAELFNLIADFNIITQYANFDLLKKQLPEEAKRLGIQ